jgi:hypothetical protein
LLVGEVQLAAVTFRAIDDGPAAQWFVLSQNPSHWGKANVLSHASPAAFSAVQPALKSQ